MIQTDRDLVYAPIVAIESEECWLPTCSDFKNGITDAAMTDFRSFSREINGIYISESLTSAKIVRGGVLLSC